MRALLKLLVLPPGVLFVLAALGWTVRRRFKRTGRWMLLADLALAYALCTPLAAAWLMSSLERSPALELERARSADAIVVLSADVETDAREYAALGAGSAADTVGELTLVRLRYAAALQRATGLPLLVTGGTFQRAAEPVGELMRRVLEDELGVPVTWVEDCAQTTWQNAALSRRLLPSEVRRVVLVTHAWHMPRAKGAFEKVGFEVLAGPTDFRARPRLELAELVPSSRALRESAFAVHEWLGRAAYAGRRWRG